LSSAFSATRAVDLNMKHEIRSLFFEGTFVGRRKVVSKSSNQAARSPAILAKLAYTYWEIGSLDDAIRTFRTAAMLAPASEAISLGLFHCLWEAGDRPRALEEAKRFTVHSNSEGYAEIMKQIKRRRTQH